MLGSTDEEALCDNSFMYGIPLSTESKYASKHGDLKQGPGYLG